MKEADDTERINVLKSGEGMFYSPSIAEDLLKSCIYSKFIGLDSSTKNIGDFLVPPYLLDPYATAYIYSHKVYHSFSPNAPSIIQQILSSLEYKIFQYWTDSKHYLIDGHKFGGNFLVYDEHPERIHAKYLLFVEGPNKKLERNHISRLSGMCKKIGLIGNIEQGGKLLFQEIKYQSKRKSKQKSQQ